MQTAKEIRKILKKLNGIADHLEGLGFEAQQLVIDKVQDQLEQLAEAFEGLQQRAEPL